MNPQFVVDVLDSAGNLLGAGPISSAVSVAVTKTLDCAGEVSVIIPATDARAVSLLANERLVRVKNAAGVMGTGVVRKRSTHIGDQPTIEIGGPDLLDMLNRYTCGRARLYDDEAVSTVVIPDLLSGTGWTAGAIDAGLGNVSARFDGETRLGAIQSIRDRLGVHIREGATAKTLEMGAFGVDSGIRLTNVEHALVDQEANTTIGLVAELSVVSDSWSAVNRIFPYGAGDGDGQLTLREVSGAARLAATHVRAGPRHPYTACWGTLGSTDIELTSAVGFVVGDPIFIGPPAGTLAGDCETNTVTAVNLATNHLTLAAPLLYDHSQALPPMPPRPMANVWAWPEYYIEDGTSQTAYGLIERTIAWKDISPIGNSDADVEAAANALYDVANAYLQWNKDAQIVYGVGGIKVPTTLCVGDKVRLTYKGRVLRDGVLCAWLDVDTLFYVLKIVRQYGADGSETCSLEISNIAKQAMSDSGLVVGALQANEVWKTHVMTYPCRYQDTTSQLLWDGVGCAVIVPIDIDESCVALNSVKIHFKTKDILLPGLWVSHPLGTDHSHDFSNDSSYGQNVFTTVIRLRVALISGGGTPVDLTTLLGGPWAGGANVHIDEEADITEILRQAVGGIKQKHVLSFTCDIGQGILECAVKMSMTVQNVMVG